MGLYETPQSTCPYCANANCDADWVDNGVGMVQCGPYVCEKCGATEIGPEGHEKDNWGYLPHISEKEKETGWYDPTSVGDLLRCIRCNKKPDELSEYVDAAKDLNMSPSNYVKMEEGTYDKFERNKFYCTPCYVAVGQPLLPNRR